MSETTTAPAFRLTADFWKSPPPMPQDDFPGAEGFIADVYPNPDGSEMAAGYFGTRALAFYVGLRSFAP
ncbi:hypothetical protein ACFTSD_11120 [Nocardiaceae bacterium NPDC056970]